MLLLPIVSFFIAINFRSDNQIKRIHSPFNHNSLASIEDYPALSLRAVDNVNARDFPPNQAMFVLQRGERKSKTNSSLKEARVD